MSRVIGRRRVIARWPGGSAPVGALITSSWKRCGDAITDAGRDLGGGRRDRGAARGVPIADLESVVLQLLGRCWLPRHSLGSARTATRQRTRRGVDICPLRFAPGQSDPRWHPAGDGAGHRGGRIPACGGSSTETLCGTSHANDRRERDRARHHQGQPAWGRARCGTGRYNRKAAGLSISHGPEPLDTADVGAITVLQTQRLSRPQRR